MLSAGYCALVLEIFLFMVVAARCWWELLGTSPRCALLLRRVRGRPQDLPGELVPTEEGESGSGVGARRSVQGMVAVACTARAGIIAFMLVHGGWVPYVALPDLVYLATYGFLVVFLAQMQQIVVGNRYLWVKIATSASLATVLVVSLIVCTARWGMEPLSNTSVLLRKFLYYELGVTYLLMFVAFVYFGARICVSQTCKGLFYRVLVLTSVCGLALSSKGAFFVAAAANAWRTDALFPSRSGRYSFEALIALEELLPSIAILLLTSRGKGRRYPSGSPSETMGFGRYSNSPMFNNVSSISPGPITNSPFTYGSAINHA